MSTLVTTGNRSLAKANSNGPTFPSWSAWIDEMFNDNQRSVFTSTFNSGITLPKVNIRETKDAYYVDMAIPGMKKSDFHINLDNKLLSISTEITENTGEKEENYTRREFALPEIIKEEKIKAVYTNGILSIHLPKKEEAIQKPPRSIKIS